MAEGGAAAGRDDVRRALAGGRSRAQRDGVRGHVQHEDVPAGTAVGVEGAGRAARADVDGEPVAERRQAHLLLTAVLPHGRARARAVARRATLRESSRRSPLHRPRQDAHLPGRSPRPALGSGDGAGGMGRRGRGRVAGLHDARSSGRGTDAAAGVADAGAGFDARAVGFGLAATVRAETSQGQSPSARRHVAVRQLALRHLRFRLRP